MSYISTYMPILYDPICIHNMLIGKLLLKIHQWRTNQPSGLSAPAGNRGPFGTSDTLKANIVLA